MSYEEDQTDRLYDEVIYLRGENARLLHSLKAVGLELQSYKEHYHRILNLQAEALLFQSPRTIIIKKSELGLESSAAEVAAKQSKDKEATP